MVGSTLCLLDLAFALLVFLGGKPRTTDDKLPWETARQVVVPLGPKAGDVPPAPVDEFDWVDASRDAVQRGDVRVRVTAVTVGPLLYKNAAKQQIPSDAPTNTTSSGTFQILMDDETGEERSLGDPIRRNDGP